MCIDYECAHQGCNIRYLLAYKCNGIHVYNNYIYIRIILFVMVSCVVLSCNCVLMSYYH